MIDPELILIDGNNLLFQSAFAFPSLGVYNPADGVKTPTGAIYGFFDKLIELDRKYKADIVVCWDVGKPERMNTDPTYKQKRNEKKLDEKTKLILDAVNDQRNVVRALLSLAGRRQCWSTGYEADDVIATLCRRTNSLTGIYSGDKDLYQLLKYGHVWILKNKGDTYRASDFMDEFTITPDAYFHMQVLIGCKTDEVEGITGVGPKTAVKVLKETRRRFNAEDYDWQQAWAYCRELHVDGKKGNTFSKRVVENITRGADILANSSSLVRLYDQIKLEWNEIPLTDENVNKMVGILRELEMKKFMREENINCIIARYKP